MSQKPITELRYGKVRAAIWRNETKAGIFHSVTFSRLYKTEQGKWADSNSFNRQDLLVLAKLAEKAFVTLNESLGEEEEDASDKQ